MLFLELSKVSGSTVDVFLFNPLVYYSFLTKLTRVRRPGNSSGVYIYKSIVNDLRHGNFIYNQKSSRTEVLDLSAALESLREQSSENQKHSEAERKQFEDQLSSLIHLLQEKSSEIDTLREKKDATIAERADTENALAGAS